MPVSARIAVHIDSSRTDDREDPSVDAPAGARVVEHLTLGEAEELLDWLEGHGIPPSEVRVEPDGRITIAWVG